MGTHILTQLKGKFKLIFGCFSAFHGQRSVAEAGTNPSPWSIRKWYQDVMYVNEELKTEVLEKVIQNRMMIFQTRVRFLVFRSFLKTKLLHHHMIRNWKIE